jgi:DNA invertase Pin-like site-specific DNA recombinase
MTAKRKPYARTAATAGPGQAIGYVRVSTDEQDLGAQAQEHALRTWASKSGVELVAVFTDEGVSGASPLDKRPGLQAALDSVGEGAVIVAHRRDRYARDVALAAMLERLVERNGARLVTVEGNVEGDGPEAQLMRAILDCFAQFERALIRSRTKAALGRKRAKGERIGSVAPYGYRFDGLGRVVADAEEQGVVARVLRERAAGLSLGAIVAGLERDGVPARGERWHKTTVMRLCQVAKLPARTPR